MTHMNTFTDSTRVTIEVEDGAVGRRRNAAHLILIVPAQGWVGRAGHGELYAGVMAFVRLLQLHDEGGVWGQGENGTERGGCRKKVTVR